MNEMYDDIINLPHHTSVKRTRMSMMDRAAQFLPFAALTGYDAAVKETARLTEEKIELDEYSKVILNERLYLLSENIEKFPEVMITYFQPDDRKAGGAYLSVTGSVKKIDDYEKNIILTDKRKIPIEDIIKIEGEIFGVIP